MIQVDVLVIARDGGAVIRTVVVTYHGESLVGLYAKAEQKQDQLNGEIDQTKFYTQIGDATRALTSNERHAEQRAEMRAHGTT